MAFASPLPHTANLGSAISAHRHAHVMLAQKDKTAASAAIFMSVRRTNVGRVLATTNWQALAAGEARESSGNNFVISNDLQYCCVSFFDQY